MNELEFFYWFVLAVVLASCVAWGVSALMERRAALAAGDIDAAAELFPPLAQLADDDYTYAEQPEMLLPHYDVRTYPQRADERIAALEDAVRKLARRIEALENRP